ncbi:MULTISPECIES: thioredoxin family protein [Thiorhodovibrio]|uniref:thioredoxin family protein n=1 Tax=Thiorhodovibrio TaxID=61593 RepID=UPI001912DA05|nr:MULTISPECIES: thioredoxin fold domain-containing protein [Thiorhodovibrio]MBK5970322.1 hypothetical protein [Thiorhodovibrio winogradskyi]WPL13678.1 Thioredoxin-related protein [Thiorhodovibrio litoralis]
MHHQFMHRVLLIGCLWLASLGTAQAGDFDDATVMHIDKPAWFKDSFLDLPEDIEEARAAGKQGLMILFTTQGCSYCAEFIRTSLGDPTLAARLQTQFDAIGLEIFSDAELTAPDGTSERVKTFAKRAGAGFAPTLLFYGEGGELLYRGVGYHDPQRFGLVLDYLTEGHPEEQSFADFAATRPMTPQATSVEYQLAPDPLFTNPPYALSRQPLPADHPLLVIFEANGCGDCARFHQEVLTVPEVRQQLERFEVVRLDTEDDQTPILAPDGQATTPAQWWAATGFSERPALLFFDEQGSEVLGTDALVLRQRMLNSIYYVLERAYEKDWTYQRFARTRALERVNSAQDKGGESR